MLVKIWVLLGLWTILFYFYLLLDVILLLYKSPFGNDFLFYFYLLLDIILLLCKSPFDNDLKKNVFNFYDTWKFL